MKRTMTIVILVFLLSIGQARAWEWGTIERPYHSNPMRGRYDNSYSNGEVSLGVGVALSQYTEADGDYGGNDVIDLNVTMDCNSRRGTTYGYSVEDPQPPLWWNVYEPTGISGDDEGGWIDFPEGFTFRFYGAQGSGEYYKVWVCTNGFISFDLSNSTSATPSDIPSTTKPNAIIAAFWTDLEVDATGSITTGTVMYLSRTYFVISWNNVKHNGVPQTFQIALQDAYYPNMNPQVQSNIQFNYGNLWMPDTSYTIGIEDNEGGKGVGPGLKNGNPFDPYTYTYKTIDYWQASSTFFLEKYTIRLEEEDPEAKVKIDIDSGVIRGMNCKRQESVPIETDPSHAFLRCLAGTALFLLEMKSGLLLLRTARTLVPLIASGTLLGWDYLDCFSYWMEDKVEHCEFADSYRNSSDGGHIVALPEIEYSADAIFGICVDWVFLDSGNSASHSLRVTAELEYYEYTQSGQVIEKDPVTTSVDIEVGHDDNEDFSTADPISEGSYSLLYLDFCAEHDPVDYYQTYVPYGYHIDLTMSPPATADYNLYLYDPSQELRAQSEHGTGQDETIDYSVLTAGNWYVKVNAPAGDGFYNLSINIYKSTGCPFVSTWNGNQFLIDNNILRDSTRYNGTEVEDYYRLEQNLVPLYEGYFNSYYSLQINEFQQEHSYLDEAQLFAVDHQANISVGVSPTGEILTYQSPYAPFSAVDENLYSWLDKINEIDGDYYEGFNGSYLTCNFGDVCSSDAKLILRTDPPQDYPPTKTSIHILVQNMTGDWAEAASIIPRTYWAIDIIDLSAYLPLEGELVVRLYFTANHRVDFVGLDTTPQVEVDVEEANLLLAYHSDEGVVTAALISDDDVCAELIPDQQIILLFSVAKPDAEARTFIFYVKGYYYTITG